MTESDKKAVEEFLKIWDSRSAFNSNDSVRDKTIELLLKTRQEAREEGISIGREMTLDEFVEG